MSRSSASGIDDGVDLDAPVERDLVAHREGADEDVDLAVVVDVEEEQALAAVEGVEGDVRLVPLGTEEPGCRAHAAFLVGDEIEVGVGAPERRRKLAGSPQPHPHPAEQPKRNLLGFRSADEALALGDDVLVDHAHV